MPDFLNKRSDVDFTGYDITESNIETHKRKFRLKPWIFKVITEIFIFDFDLILQTKFLAT